METSIKLMSQLQIHEPLIKWYQKNKRPLPWRKNTEPYSVWLSEIILQQTRIDQGTSYYLKIINRLPNVQKMAEVAEEELLFLWKGLGYYSRARNMLKAANMICDEYKGQFPDSYNELLRLPGIGPYTAAAIASISFGETKAVVDGNVARVISRLLAIRERYGTALLKQAQQHADAFLDKKQPGDFNQAMMELGALICKPQKPLCTECPLQSQCKGLKAGIQNAIPLPKLPNRIRKRYFNYLLILDDENNCLIHKRNDKKDIWLGLYEFPLIETQRQQATEKLLQHKEFVKLFDPSTDFFIEHQSKTIKHQLSHQQITSKLLIVRTPRLPVVDGYVKIADDALSDYPVPRLIEKLLEEKPS